MALIDLSNYDSTLAQSTAGRAGNANGNIFFDTTNGILELITAEEQAYVDLTNAGTPTGSTGVAADSGTPTSWYVITAVNGSDFTAVGAASSTVGLVFQYSAGSPGGTGTMNECTANPLIEDDGVKLEALYAFERQERRVDENLRKFDYFMEGTFKFGGAYKFVNDRKLYDTDAGGADSLTGDDRFKVRGSGWEELDGSGNLCRIFYGNKSLGNIEATSLPYYQASNDTTPDLNAITPVVYDKDGPVDEAIQVYGDNNFDTNAYTTSVATAASQTISVVKAAGTFTRSAGSFVTDGFEIGHRFDTAGLTNNTGTYTVDEVTATVITIKADEWADLTDETGDADEQLTVTGNDTRLYLSMKVRTFGYNFDEKILSDSGVTEMGGYNTGFALNETTHLTSGSYTYADVWSAQISPWTGMGLERLASPQSETGFTTADGNFRWVLNNTVPGNLNECIAFLDALAMQDSDIDDGATTVTYGKRNGTWYTYNAAGKILPRVGTGAAGEGFFIEQLVGTDKNRVIFTDDAGSTKEYPFYLSVSVTVGAGAVADTNAWFHAFYLNGPGAGDDFNTTGALTVRDADGATLIKGNVSGSGLRTGNVINYEYDYAADGISGGGDADVVFECEGDGGVTQAKTVFTMTDPAIAASITASCVPGTENNV